MSTDGSMVTDTITGLVWQRDAPSATYSQTEAETYCSSLSLGGFSDWRLPAEHELMSIVDVAKDMPAIDRAAFPNTQIAQYWTSSPSAGSSDKAWYIYFTSGWTSFDDKGSRYNVRCVRGSRCYPTSRFVVGSGSSSGLVTDTLTNLVWQQQKSATRMTWTDAQTYCPSGFRLPTVKELESIVDLTVNSGGPSNRPAINQSAFPIPADIFWTSSASASNMPPYVTLAWSVDFSSGSSDDNYIMSNSCWALCVQ